MLPPWQHDHTLPQHRAVHAPAYAIVACRLLDRVGHIELMARATSIVRYGPGSTVDFHPHDGGEEYIVLAGSFQDEHGQHHEGEYVRNPPTSTHETHTQSGAIVFVKNGQMRLDNRDQVNIDLATVDCVGKRGILYRGDGETVFVQELAAGEHLQANAPCGAEMFVMKGNVRDSESGDVLREWAMMRVPAGDGSNELSLVAEEGGAKVWVKIGPFWNTTGPRPVGEKPPTALRTTSCKARASLVPQLSSFSSLVEPVA